LTFKAGSIRNYLEMLLGQEKHMARPKTLFTKEMTERAWNEREGLRKHDEMDKIEAVVKLSAIAAASRNPEEVEMITRIFRVTTQTLWRWGVAYKKDGMEGLYTKPKKPKPSKLTPEQKAEVFSWVKARKTADGKDVRWTLKTLRTAISDRFGVTLSINTISIWLQKEELNLKALRHH